MYFSKGKFNIKKKVWELRDFTITTSTDVFFLTGTHQGVRVLRERCPGVRETG